QKTLRTALGRIIHLSMRRFWRFAREQGFSMTQMIALRQVHHQDAMGGCSVSDISDRLGVTNAAVSQSLDKLVHLGLVERHENPQDRRSKQILLTPQGEEILKDSMRTQHAWLEELSTRLTPDEQVQIEAAFRLLLEKINDME
ncbi:MAG: MarR family transcriptional regulator, partial [Anaerolineales bacterium]|nr:MarR family transcriptional regulator [Anaerolineales bacterium]